MNNFLGKLIVIQLFLEATFCIKKLNLLYLTFKNNIMLQDEQ